MMDMGLTQKLKQEQTLSPQMLQALSLLPLPIMELRQHIQREIETNPALEIPTSWDSINDGEFNNIHQNQDSYGQDFEGSNYESIKPKGSMDDSDSKNLFLENTLVNEKSLQDYLIEQLNITNTDNEINELCLLLISNLDENGFFLIPINELSNNNRINEAINIVQQFDPPGICVKDFRESIILQAERKGMKGQELEIFKKIIYDYLDRNSEKKAKETARELKISEEELVFYYQFLRTLTPFPGKDWGSIQHNFVVPELSIHNKDGNLVMDMNRSYIPPLEIATDFESLGSEINTKDKETKKYYNESLRNARVLIDQVEMRFQTLYKAGLSLMEKQKEFFLNGPKYLKPLTLKEVSEEIGVHETTVSRLSQAKWIETDWGLIQMKNLFTQGVGDVSRTAVKDIIKEIIDKRSQDGLKPLSDQKLSDILEQKGIKIARRTVSKYRKELNIDSSFIR